MLAINYLQLKNNQKISSYTATEKLLEGKKQLTVPVTMIVEGVLNGSMGPLLHLAEDFGKIPESWNGIPIVIYHPEQDGHGISANNPEVLEKSKVGFVFYSHIEDNKLKAEAWLDEEKLKVVSNATLLAINAGTTMELSVGVFTENEEIAGEFNGIKYNAIARNHRPDHLALLPDGVGACSLENGCGMGVNQMKGENNVDRLDALKVVRDSNYSVIAIGMNMAQGLKQKLDELYDLVRTLRVPSDANGNGGTWTYLEEAYDTFLIYSVEESGKDTKLYKSNYQFSVTDGEPEFVGDPIEVEKKVQYEPIISNNEKLILNKQKEKTIMEDVTKCTPCIQKKATELIANAATKFTEADRGWLETFEESVLDKMVPVEVEGNATVTPEEMLKKGEAMMATDPIAGAAMVKKAKAMMAKLAGNALSAEDQAALALGKLTLANKKAEMVANIQANTEAGLWTPEILDNMDSTMLEKISKSVSKKAEETVDYSLNGNAFQSNSKGSEIEPLLPNV